LLQFLVSFICLDIVSILSIFQLVGIQVFEIFSNEPLDCSSIYCNIPFFFSNFINLGLSFFWLILLRFCQFCW
jgi:hypothetical protein